jgi:hypothetical protein
MKPTYHLSKLTEVEKKAVQDFFEHHSGSYDHVARHVEADLHGRPMAIDLKVDKTDEPRGHCKYTVNFHLHMPQRGEHVIKKEGFNLIEIMKDVVHAMDRHIEPVVEKSKAHRYKEKPVHFSKPRKEAGSTKHSEMDPHSVVMILDQEESPMEKPHYGADHSHKHVLPGCRLRPSNHKTP